ncbi:MAG: cadmium-translocating P-type ATPase [Cyclobacteriaceae bacterium]|jgi:Zn2+/Cd2+-exporting ATPase|nr:cadmium-translocating P-type ATPase [Cyclobacteriaceae bacterium]MCK6617127.1 cadmium-translocating P-type ATPase [Cyclobacteriaceae bacterium]
MTNHQHTNIQSDDTCCTPDLNAVNQNKNTQSKQTESESGISREWLSAIASFILLAAGLVLDNWIQPSWFEKTVRFAWYAVAYVPVGLPVLFKGIRIAFRGDMFTEFILMSIATLGAFYIGEYPEGVAVMLFYAVGELFQDAAVNKAKRSIKALMDMRPDTANVFRNGKFDEVDPTNVVVGETIQIKVGERVPLDGEMLSDGSSFNTAALTGESKPKSIDKGETVLAGMINEQKVVEVKVTKLFNESSLARILTLVQNATGRKAKTELFIRKFARVYTPIVVFLALALTLLPYFFVDNYVFNDWLYRALIFLVISCPCALVVAIPLGYFGGIGAGSRNGILFKGSNYLDLMTRVDTIVMDKTGTLTKGVFKVQKVEGPLDQKEWVPLIAALESQSTHPIAKAVVEYADSNFENLQVSDIEEIKGHGLKGTVNGKQVLAGNVRLLDKFGVAVTEEVRTITDSIVVASVNGTFAGYITIADELKEDSKEAIRQMHASKLKTVMLSGDKQVVANKIAKALNIDQAHGDLLPEHKVMKVEEIKAGKKEPIAFVGDGINDAPVLAISDVGIAMGGLGSDAAIETADVVIQTDQPSKIVTAIKIGKATNQIVWQNIALAFGVKVIVMALGAGGLATMWEAVFADVGVALLAILNAVRIQRMRF